MEKYTLTKILRVVARAWLPIAVTNVEKLRAYQLKGRAKVVTNGELFERALKLVEERMKKRRKRLKERLKKED